MTQFSMLNLFIFVLALIAIADCGKAPVMELSDSFLQVDLGEEPWFIAFYSPSCGHCKRLEPAFDEAARQLAARRPDVHVARIDATSNRAAADKYGVNGYPTIVLIKKTEVHHYNGDRSVESLVSFVDRMSSETITEIKNSKELEKILNGITKDSVFIYVGDKSVAGNNLFADFQRMAERRKSFNRFYLLPKASIFEKLGFKVFRVPSIFAVKSRDDFEEFYPSKDKWSLPFDQWVISERFSIVPRFSGYDGYAARDLSKLVVLVLIKGDKPTDEQLEIITRAARTARGRRFVFAWTNDSETHNRLVGWFVRPISVFCANLTDLSYYDPSDQHEALHMSGHHKLHPNHQESTSATALESFNKLSDFIEWVDIIRYAPDHRYLLQNMVRGGLGLNMRLKRMFFTVIEFVVNVYNESIILFLLFFGLPLGLFSLLFYLLCCSGDHSDNAQSYDDLGSDDEGDLIEDERAQFSRELEEGGFEPGEEDEAGEMRRRAMLHPPEDEGKNL